MKLVTKMQISRLTIHSVNGFGLTEHIQLNNLRNWFKHLCKHVFREVLEDHCILTDDVSEESADYLFFSLCGSENDCCTWHVACVHLNSFREQLHFRPRSYNRRNNLYLKQKRS